MSHRVARALRAPLSRSDYLLLKVTLVAIALLGVATVVHVLWPRPDVAFVQGVNYAGPAEPVQGAAPNVQRAWGPSYSWVIRHAAPLDILLAGLPTGLYGLALTGAAVILLRLVAALERDRAFTPSAVGLVRGLGLLSLAAGVLLPFVSTACQFALVARHDPHPGTLFTFSLAEFSPIVVGLLVLALAEVFAKGVRLQADVDGLV